MSLGFSIGPVQTQVPGSNRREMPPIGDEGLSGEVRHGMVTIGGPCGGEHTMSVRTARQLRDWLDRQPEITGRPVIEVEGSFW